MEHIVVGLDGSPPSFIALDWAAERAARGPSRVEIFTVERADPLAEPAAVIGAAERRLTDRAPDAEFAFSTSAGRMPQALLHAAETADLLVIGAHRRRRVRAALSGWLPLRTVSRSPVPAVVVPEDWTFDDGPILVGVDDDDSSSAAVPFAAREAAASTARLSLLHAWQMPVAPAGGAGALPTSPARTRAAHRELLDRAGDRVAQAQPALHVDRILVQDNPSSALMSRSMRASLLVLGTHHRGPVEGAFRGSVCQDALWLSACPVCVVPARSVSDVGTLDASDVTGR
jgi:nucleotide-binding universal stress UspA family protein